MTRSIDGLNDETIRHVLETTKRVALVGASDRPERAAREVQAFLQRRGYEVTPINPRLVGHSINGRQVVAELSEATPLDMVDLFRASEHVGPIVDDAIRLGARVIWMQLGVVDQAAAERGRAAGMMVVMDRCPVIETRRLL